jgi:hypothetical protein
MVSLIQYLYFVGIQVVIHSDPHHRHRLGCCPSEFSLFTSIREAGQREQKHSFNHLSPPSAWGTRASDLRGSRAL